MWMCLFGRCGTVIRWWPRSDERSSMDNVGLIWFRRDEPSRAFRKSIQNSMWSPLSQLMYAWWQCRGYEFIYLECRTWRAAWYRISLRCEITILSFMEAASGWTYLTSDIWLSWAERYFGESTPSRGHTCELSCSNSALSPSSKCGP